MAMIVGKKPPVFTPYLAQRRDGTLSLIIGCSTRHWLDPFARVKSSLLLKIHGPSERELKKRQTEPVTYGHHNGGEGTLRQPPSIQD